MRAPIAGTGPAFRPACLQRQSGLWWCSPPVFPGAQEGKTRLTAQESKDAVAQQVEVLTQQLQVKPSAQIAASLATLAGLLTGGTVGEGVRSGAHDVWRAWVDSGFVLHRAGCTAEATALCVAAICTDNQHTRKRHAQ